MNKVKLNEAQADSVECKHVDQAKEVSYGKQVCPECVKMGDTWVHLRICMLCGHVGCCDNSKNKHATAHFKASGHPIIKSIQPGEDWAWCYVDEVYLE
ncbi:MAG TPA: UBP-type zinc finger domain-containing protein [Gammaproteobacteria bacterium]|nr:UBP-type zinc finger domain-containing protein [Gammaproteobacteria bacterium]